MARWVKWAFRPGALIVLSVALVGVAALVAIPSRHSARTQALPISGDDQEIAWLYPATSTTTWARFLSAAEYACERLQPVFVTDFRRSVLPLQVRDSHIELAIDQGEIKSGAGKVAIYYQTWGSFSVNDVSAFASVWFTGGVDDMSRDNEVRDLLQAADTANDPGKRKELYAKAQPIPRAGIPDDIAQCVAWLASDRSTFVNATDIVVDGGVIGGRNYSQHHEGLKQVKGALGI